MNTSDLQKSICKNEILKHNLPCENVKYVLNHEIDVLSINKNNFLVEYEVKISRSDFLADKKKKKWTYWEWGNKFMPNYFCYVCPEGMIKEEEIDKRFGLCYISESTLEKGEFILSEIKKPKLLHKDKFDTDNIIKKFIRITQERLYLGCCYMTRKNNIIKQCRLDSEYK